MGMEPRTFCSWPEIIQLFFMLNSAKTKIIAGYIDGLNRKFQLIWTISVLYEELKS